MYIGIEGIFTLFSCKSQAITRYIFHVNIFI